MSTKKENLLKSTTVTSEESLKNAVKVGYGKIRITGEYANQVANKIAKSSTGNKLSNAGMLIGLFFTPLFIAGIFGKILTKDMAKYEIVSVSDNVVILKHKSHKE